MIFSSDSEKKATILTKREHNKVCPLYLPSKEDAGDPGNLHAGWSLEVRKGAARPGKSTRAVPLQTNRAISQDFQSSLQRSVAFCGNQEAKILYLRRTWCKIRDNK